MRLDKFKNPIFNADDIFSLVYAGHINEIQNVMVDTCQEVERLESISEQNFSKAEYSSTMTEMTDFDSVRQSDWIIPSEYLDIDIEQYCISKCTNDEERTRVMEEMVEYTKRNMLPILQWMKYFVDIATEKNILWGVGRGSSVASYVLYIIGVHRINSIKYKLEWREFLR